MKAVKNFRLIGLFVALIFPQFLFGQTLRAKVNVKMSHLPPNEQQILADLPQKIADYYNNKRWGDENQDIIINCSVSLIIETVTNRGSEKVYRSQFLIGSESGENFYDKTVEFTYQVGEVFDQYQTVYKPLLGVLDFYAYMVLGGEMDTYDLFAGTPFYDKALDVANQGLISNYPLGWQKRLEEVKLITDADHIPLREAKFYYYETLYFVEGEPSPDLARQYARGVVDRLEQVYKRKPNSKALKRFLDAHYQEFCKLFKYDRDRRNVEKLIEIDPRHRNTYENCQSAR